MVDAVKPLVVKPLARARWRDVEKLFGPQGAIMGCWCMYWRMKRPDWDAARGAKTKSLFKARVEKGPAPGLIAYADGEPVGWMQIGPRADAPQWNTPRRVSAPEPDAPEADERVWGVTCFFVKTAWRGKGVASALVDAGVAYARERGARLIEVCPIEGKASAGAAYVGRASLFARAGFKEIARRKENRPLMRLELQGGGKRSSTASKSKRRGA